MNEDLHSLLTKHMPDAILLLSEEPTSIPKINEEVKNSHGDLIPEYQVHLVNDEFKRVLNLDKAVADNNEQKY